MILEGLYCSLCCVNAMVVWLNKLPRLIVCSRYILWWLNLLDYQGHSLLVWILSSWDIEMFYQTLLTLSCLLDPTLVRLRWHWWFNRTPQTYIDGRPRIVLEISLWDPCIGCRWWYWLGRHSKKCGLLYSVLGLVWCPGHAGNAASVWVLEIKFLVWAFSYALFQLPVMGVSSSWRLLWWDWGKLLSG